MKIEIHWWKIQFFLLIQKMPRWYQYFSYTSMGYTGMCRPWKYREIMFKIGKISFGTEQHGGR